MKRQYQNNSGVALLMSLGLLALLSIVGIAFATNMRLGQRTLLDFIRNLQVRYIAEGGVQRAIGELKYHHAVDFNSGNGAKYGYFDTRFINGNEGEYWYYGEKYGSNDQNGNGIPFEYMAGVPLEDAPEGVPLSEDSFSIGNYTAQYALKIIDTGSQINVNDDDNGDLETILRNLCSYLGSPLNADDGTLIYNERPYGTRDDVRLAFDTNNDGILTSAQENKYNLIKDFITVNSYEDPNNSPDNDVAHAKAPININTASWQVIASILMPLLDGDSAKAESAAKNMVLYNNVPVRYLHWAAFRWALENYTSLTAEERETVHKSVNPNRVLDQVNDVKFGFNSGGFYEIESLATIKDSFDNIIASKKISTTVKIFDLWNMTTKAQFRDNVAVEDNGNRKARWVNWWDRCPIDLTDSYSITYSYDEDNTISGSLKLGYWDDFDDDEEGSANEGPDLQYRQNVWKNFDETDEGGNPHDVPFIAPMTVYNISGGALHASDNSGVGQWPLVTIGYDIDRGASLDTNERWYSDNFLLKAYITDGGISQHYIPYEYLGASNLQRKYDAVTQVIVRAGSFNENTTVYLSISDGPSEAGHPQPPGPPYPVPDPTHQNYYPEYNADPDQSFNPAEPPRTPPPPSLATVAIIRGTNDKRDETPPFPFINYVDNKIFEIEGHLNPSREWSPPTPEINRIDTTIYNQAGGLVGSETLSTSLLPGPTSHRGVGAIGFYGATMPFDLDNVRVIADEGHYESKSISVMIPAIVLPPAYEWGTVWTTLNLSPGADIDKEIVQINHKTIDEDDWTNYWPGSGDRDALGQLIFGGDGLWRQINEPDSTDIQFHFALLSNHDGEGSYEYNKIPVLEDVWITYLPKTRIIYWRDGGD